MDPHDAKGQIFFGTIKSYSISKGYGFAISDKLHGDLFFLHKNLPKEVIHRTQDDRDFKLEGREVAFTVDITDTGKPTATEMRILAEMGPWSGQGKGKGKIRAGRDDWDDDDDYDRRGKGGDGYMRDSFPRGSYAKERDTRDSARGGRDTRDGRGKGYNPYDDYNAEGKGHTGITVRSTTMGKGQRSQKKEKHMEDGIPLTTDRIQAKMKSYSNGSKWGFAIAEPGAGEFGDIFVHSNNLDPALSNKGIQLRDGDVIEMDVEELDGKPVAKRITLVAQEADAYSSQWMRGTITQFENNKGYGFIEAPRIWGDIWFSKADLAKSMWNKCVDSDVMFRLNVGADGKPKAKFVNPVRGCGGREGEERAQEIIHSLHADGFVDDTAVKNLQDTDPGEFMCILPELAFYKADNPSSFILGALSRSRKGGRGEKGARGGKQSYRAGPY